MASKMSSGIFILAIYFLLHFINIFQLIVWKHQASMGILISPKPDFPLHTHTSIKPLAKCDNKTSGRKKKCGISGSGWEGDFPYATYTLLLFPDLFTFWLLQTFLTICLHLLTKGVKFKSKEGVQAFWNRVWKLTNSSILACILSMFNHNTRGPILR